MNEDPSFSAPDDLVQLKVESRLMSVLRNLALWSFACSVALFLGASGGFGTRYTAQRSPPQPAVFPWAGFTFLFSLACLVARLLMGNHYLLDTKERRLSRHFRFLWFHFNRLLFEQADLLAVTTQGRKYFHRGGGWEYRVVVVGKSGLVVPLGRWKREVADEQPGLEECKTEAARLAGLLDCPCLESPPIRELVVSAQRSPATVTFAPLRYGCTRLERRAALIFVLLLAGGFLLLELYAHSGF